MRREDVEEAIVDVTKEKITIPTAVRIARKIKTLSITDLERTTQVAVTAFGVGRGATWSGARPAAAITVPDGYDAVTAEVPKPPRRSGKFTTIATLSFLENGVELARAQGPDRSRPPEGSRARRCPQRRQDHLRRDARIGRDSRQRDRRLRRGRRRRGSGVGERHGPHAPRQAHEPRPRDRLGGNVITLRNALAMVSLAANHHRLWRLPHRSLRTERARLQSWKVRPERSRRPADARLALQ